MITVLYAVPRLAVSRVAPKTTPRASSQTPSHVITLRAMGDMLAHDSIVSQAKREKGYDFRGYFTDIAPRLRQADAVFCNPETPVAGEQLGVSGYPTFNAPNEFARDLTGAGCTIINLATNHMYDKGQTGIDESRSVWHQQPLLAMNGANSSSEQQREVSYFEKNGVKCAFIAFADFSNSPVSQSYSVNMYHDVALVTQLMTEARTHADIVIVSAHWGTEDSSVVNQDQRDAAKLFARLGADIVIGTGPHVLQTVERVAGNDGHTALVWYSIGNMLSSQLQANELTSVIASMKISKVKGAYTVTAVEAIPTFMSYKWTAADRAAERLAARSNLQLRTLKNAAGDIASMFPNETYDSRRAFISSTLGDLVTIND